MALSLRKNSSAAPSVSTSTVAFLAAVQIDGDAIERAVCPELPPA